MDRLRVLVVDDDPAYLAAARRILDGLRFQVVGIAETGDEAATEVVRAGPDIVLVDLHLEGQLGFKVGERLKNLLPGLRLVFMSTDDALVYRDLALVYGGLGFLPKRSLTPEALVAIAALG